MDELHGKTDHDLLIMAVSEMKQLRSDFDRVSNGTGFPRCAERLVVIKDTQDDLKEHLESHKWYHRKVAGVGIALAIAAWWDKLVALFSS